MPLTLRIPQAFLICLGLVGLFLGGCRKGEPSTRGATSVRLATDLWPGYFPLLIAQERGYFRERNLDVEISFPEDTHGMLADFASGKYDGAFASVGDLIVTSRQSPGARFILCTDESAGADQIIGISDYPDANKLRGVRVGTTLGGFGELLVRRFLASRGLTNRDVSVVNSDAAEVPALLDTGKLEVGHTWEPYASHARSRGHHVLYTSAQTPGLVMDGLLMRGEFLRQHPAATKALVAAWFQALDWWESNPQEGDRIIRAHLEKRGKGPVLTARDGIRLLDRAANRQVFKSGTPNGLDVAVREYVELFLSRGSLPQRVAPDDVLDGSFLE